MESHKIIKTGLLIGFTFGILMALISASYGQNEALSPPPPQGSQGKLSERVRYVPFSDFKEVFEKSPKGYLIPRNVYESMKQAKEAYLARRPQSPIPKLDLDYSMGKAQYIGSIQEQVGEFEATFNFMIPQERWVLLPLPSGDLGVTEVTLDGQPVGICIQNFSGIEDQEAPKGKVALLQQQYNAFQAKSRAQASKGRTGVSNEYLVAIKGQGNHSLRVRFAVPQVDDPEKNELTFRIPRVSMNTFEIILDRPAQIGEVDRSEGTVSNELNENQTKISGILGPTDRFSLRWAPKTIPTGPKPLEEASQSVPLPEPRKKIQEPPLVYADSSTLLSFGEGFIRSEILVQLNITRSPKGQVSFFIPKGTKVLEVRSDRLESHEVQEVSKGNRLVCHLNAQVQSSIGFQIICETKMSDTSEEVTVPVLQVEGVEHDHGFIGVEARTSIEIAKVDESLGNLDVSPVDTSALPPELSSRATRSILLAFRYLAVPFSKPLKLQITRHNDIPVLTTIIDQIWATTVFGTDKTSVTCLDMKVKNNGQQYLKVNVGSGSWIESASVEGTPATLNQSGSSTYLITLVGKKSQNPTSGSSGEAFQVRVDYRSEIPQINLISSFSFCLPILGFNVSKLEWTIFSPDSYIVIPKISNIEKPYRQPKYFPLVFISPLFETMLTFEFLLVLIMIGCVYAIIQHFLKKKEESEQAKTPSFSYASILVLILIVGGVAIVGLTASGRSRSSVFRTFSDKLESPSEIPMGRYPTAKSTPQPPSSYESAPGMADEGYLESKLNSEPEVSKGDYENRSMKESDTFGGEKKFKSKSMLSNAPAGKGGMTYKTPMIAKPSAGKDRGALPVDMKIPSTSSSVSFYKNIVKDQEQVEMKGIFIWKPYYSIIFVAFGLTGFFTSLFIAWFSSKQWGLLSGFTFIVFSLFAFIAEEYFSGSQEISFSLFFLGLFFIIILRLLRRFFFRKEAVAAVLVLALSFPCIAATNEIDPRVEQVIDVYIPYSQLGERLWKDSSLVFLQYDEYKYLRDLGIPEPDPALWTPPVSVSFLSGNFQGQVKDGRVELIAHFEIELLGKGFKQIPFPTNGVGVKSLTLDNEPAMLTNLRDLNVGQNTFSNQSESNFQANRPPFVQQPQQMQLPQQMLQGQQMFANQSDNFIQTESQKDFVPVIITEKQGRATIDAVLVKDLFSKTMPKTKVEGFKIPIPPFAIATLDLTVDQPRQRVEVTPSAKVITTDLENQTRISAVLEPSRYLSAEWRDRVPVKIPEIEPATQAVQLVPRTPKIFADHEVLFSVSAGTIAITDKVRLIVKHDAVGEFAFRLASDVAVMEVNCADLEAWSSHPTPDGQEINVSLFTKRMNQIDIRIELERETPQINGVFALDIPRLERTEPAGEIERQNGYFGIEARGGIEVNVEQEKDNEATNVDTKELPAWIQSNVQGFLAHAYKFLSPVSPKVVVTKHKEAEVSTAQIDGANTRTLVTRDGKVITSMELTVRNNNNQFLLLEGFSKKDTRKLLSVLVNGEPVKPCLNATNEITYVPLIRSPRAGKVYQPFAVELVFEDHLEGELQNTGQFGLELPRFIGLDISEMNWWISVPERYFFVKGRSKFDIGAKNISSAPGKVFNKTLGNQISFSNVKSQGISYKTLVKEGEFAGTAGLLPVIIEIPQTSKTLAFHRQLINHNSPEVPKLQIFYIKEEILNPCLLSGTLLFGFIFSITIFALARNRTNIAFIGLALLLTVEIVAQAAHSLFGADLPFTPQLLETLHNGIQIGLFIAVIWFLLTTSNQVPKKLIPPAKEA